MSSSLLIKVWKDGDSINKMESCCTHFPWVTLGKHHPILMSHLVRECKTTDMNASIKWAACNRIESAMQALYTNVEMARLSIEQIYSMMKYFYTTLWKKINKTMGLHDWTNSWDFMKFTLVISTKDLVCSPELKLLKVSWAYFKSLSRIWRNNFVYRTKLQGSVEEHFSPLLWRRYLESKRKCGHQHHHWPKAGDVINEKQEVDRKPACVKTTDTNLVFLTQRAFQEPS